MKQVVPARGLESFSCPHVNCGAIAHQSWFKVFADSYGKDSKPWLATPADLERFERNGEDADLIAFFAKFASREIFLEAHEKYYGDSALI